MVASCQYTWFGVMILVMASSSFSFGATRAVMSVPVLISTTTVAFREGR